MSMERCTDCGMLMDTDDYPEVYRDEFQSAPPYPLPLPLCDDCYDERLKETA